MNERGALVLLEAQDRTRWDRAQIATGLALVDKALLMHEPGPYQIQAAISALHAQATYPEQTDWRQIVVLYGELLKRTYTPVIELNRAVAAGMAFGTEAGLLLIDQLARSGALHSYHPFYVARADLLRRAGRIDEARTSYLTALDLCHNAVERNVLLERLQEMKDREPRTEN